MYKTVNKEVYVLYNLIMIKRMRNITVGMGLFIQLAIHTYTLI